MLSICRGASVECFLFFILFIKISYLCIKKQKTNQCLLHWCAHSIQRPDIQQSPIKAAPAAVADKFVSASTCYHAHTTSTLATLLLLMLLLCTQRTTAFTPMYM
jgi:hypothetical protein